MGRLHKRRKIRLTLVSYLLAFGIVLSPLLPATSVYASTYSDAKAQDAARAWEAANFLRYCFVRQGHKSILRSEALGFTFFENNSYRTANVGFAYSGTGTRGCDVGGDVQDALSFTQNTTDPIALLCDVMEYKAVDSSEKEIGCKDANAAKFLEKSESDLDILSHRLYTAYFGAADKPAQREDAQYFQYFSTFVAQSERGCKAKDLGVVDSMNAEQVKAIEGGAAKISIADGGKIIEHVFSYEGSSYIVSGDSMSSIDNVGLVWMGADVSKSRYNGDYVSCDAIAQKIGELATAYASSQKAGQAEGTITPPTESGTVAQPGEKQSQCNVDSVGWIVCPVMNFIASLNDGLYDFIAGTLVVKPELFTRDSTTYKAWDVFKNYANVMFVIAFLVIIYSQVTSAGISNYGIKRMLPKIIIAAILVNISFFICQLAVDLSNIAGYGIKAIFDQLGGSITITTKADSGGWAELIGQILAGALGIGAVLALLLAVSVPVLLSAFFALALIAFILLARQALIVLLIVIAPLAFVAYLLPNTESLFKKWSKLFFSLLMLFPVISAVFGASALAAAILSTSSEPFMKIVALGATALPLFVVPGMLKGALAATGKMGAKMQGWGDKATGRVGSAAKNTANRRTAPVQDAWKYRKQQRDIKRARKIGEGSIRRGVLGKVGGGNYSGKLATQAASLEENEFNEQVKAASASVSTKSSGDALKDFDTASEAEQAAIIEHVMAKGSFNERRSLVEKSGGLTGANAKKLQKRISDGVYAKGDQNIYGSGIGAKIISGGIKSDTDLRAETLKNINDGHVSAEHLVQGESATEYMVDTATGATAAKIDPATGAVITPSAPTGVGSAADHATATAALKTSHAAAQTNTGTRSKLNGAYNATLGRL